MYTEKNPGECPVSRFVATIWIQASTRSRVPSTRRREQFPAEVDHAPEGDRVVKGKELPRDIGRAVEIQRLEAFGHLGDLPGGSRRGSRSRTLSGFRSDPTARRPSNAASSGVVPRPMKGSYTTSPGRVSRVMKKRGNWGLKQAR